MFSDFTYNMIRYAGCDPVLLPEHVGEKISHYEYNHLARNVVRPSILRCDECTLVNFADKTSVVGPPACTDPLASISTTLSIAWGLPFEAFRIRADLGCSGSEWASPNTCDCPNCIDIRGKPPSFICGCMMCAYKMDKVKVVDGGDLILSYRGETVVEKLVHYNISELKSIVRKNHGVVMGDKRLRATWVNAFINTILYGFNTFAIKSDLPHEMLCEIRKFL